MAFKEVLDLDCETTTALGGINKKTGRPNPKQIEGYYLGVKKTESKKSKNGVANLYIFQTQAGNTGVWGKTDLDRKMSSVVAGSMVRVTQNGSVPTPNGDMYKYKVEIDTANTIEVPSGAQTASDQGASSYASNEDPSDYTSDSDEDTYVDEAPPARAVAPKVAASVNSSKKAEVEALLRGRRQA